MEIEEGRENFVLVGGIGCHGKITDYINVKLSGFMEEPSLLQEGIKIQSNLACFCSGDGDSYNEEWLI